MHLRIAGDVDREVIPGVFTYKFHKLVGVAIKRGRTHARGRIAAQANEPINSCGLIVFEQRQYFLFVAATERQMRCHARARGSETSHCALGAVAGRAARAVGH